jgi:hypothetical protein
MTEPQNDAGALPRTMGHIPVCARLEMMVGTLSDQLAPTRELVAALRLRGNASATTRGELDHLNDLTGALWQRLGIITEELRTLREQGACARCRFEGGSRR